MLQIVLNNSETMTYCGHLMLKYATQYASKYGKQQWPQDWNRSVFIPTSKKGHAKECSNYHTTELISHASKVMLKFLQASFNST